MASDDPLFINVGKDASVGTATISAATDLFTLTAHGLVDGDPVMVDTLTGGTVGVLRTGVVYYVRDALTNTFGLAASPGDTLIAFSTDGGAAVFKAAPTYEAREMRRAFAALLLQGVSDRFGARGGIQWAGTDAVTLSGTTVTVQHLKGVVYPGLTSLSGPYIVQLQSGTHALNPPDGTNPRKDLIVLRIYDNDEDASGLRKAQTEYVVGTPNASPVEPAVPTGAIRLATVDVPVSPNPATLTYNALSYGLYTGILPARNSGELPTTGLYEGAYADQRDIKGLMRWDGAQWVEVARQALTTTSGLALSSGFGLIAFKAWRTGPMVTGLVEVQRTGAAIAVSASNLPDTACATLPAGWRPIQTWYGPWGDGFGAGECSITTAGLITLRATSYTELSNLANVRIPIHFPVVA